ncbi:MAG TPA: energy transducer TonB [Candidatus Eisenbacteria bacterium]|nr:energy transducer TonB [Candidatus Eisenbacteria bacterium]
MSVGRHASFRLRCLALVAAIAASQASPAAPAHAAAADSLAIYGTWRWVETKDPLPGESPNPARHGRDRILTLRADHSYELVEQDTLHEYLLCAGTFLIRAGGSPQPGVRLPGGPALRLSFVSWWKWHERVQTVRFSGHDSMVAAGFPVANAPRHSFVRDDGAVVRKRTRVSIARGGPRPGGRESAQAVAPTEGEFVYYDEAPVPVTRTGPVYPEAARNAGREGTVLLHVLVGVDGRVKNAKIARGVTGLNEAALAAVRSWTFKPALSARKPVAAWVEVPMEFRL